MRFSAMSFCGLMLLGLLMSPAAIAASGTPTVESVVPGVGGRGVEFVLTVTGGRLKQANQVLFYGSGLSCTKLDTVSENELRLTLRSERDCPLGPHPFRIRTPGGLSELKVVHVSPLSVVEEVEPNDDRKSARSVAMNTTVSGVIDSGDIDTFAVELKKGETLSAEVQAIRLGGEMTDCVLTVLDPAGKPIIQVDDTSMTRQDPFVSMVAAETGTYFVQVRDTSYGGGPASTYALHLGHFPRPAMVFPPGGEAGTTLSLTLTDSTGRVEVTRATPSRATQGWWDWYASLPGRPSGPTPTPLRIRPYPCIAESGKPAPTSIEWPVAFQGVIDGKGERDRYTFRARSGDLLQVEVFAVRVGSLLDSQIEIEGPDGQVVARNDDDIAQDSRLEFRAQTDGEYKVSISDKRGDSGPRFLYQIEVEKPRQSLTLFLPGPVRKSQNRQVIAVPRGNRVLAYVGVRREGFTAPVQVSAQGLPEGVKLDLKEIPADTYLAPIVIEAAQDAPLGTSLVSLKGMATTVNGSIQGGFQQVVDLVPGPGDSSYESALVDQVAVVVTEEAPYSVTLSKPSASLTRDGELSLKASVVRVPGYDEPIEVSLPFLPPGVEMEGPGVVPSGASEVALRLFARPDADTTGWRLAAEARPAPPRRDRRELTNALMAQLDPTMAGMRRRRPSAEGLPQVSSAFVLLDLTQAVVRGRIANSVCEQGQTISLVCSLEPRSPFATRATATLEGLPPRISADPIEVPPGATSVVFRVQIAPTAPLGEHDALVCRLNGEVGGQSVIYRVGRGSVLKVGQPGSVAPGGDGRALSPLETLRRKSQAGGGAATPRTQSVPASKPQD